MKYLKIYEAFKESDVKIGNYVILNVKFKDFGYSLSDNQKNTLVEYLNNTICEIVNITTSYSGIQEIDVKYNNIPFTLNDWFGVGRTITLDITDIFDMSDSKKELIDRHNLRQAVNKFNI